MKLLITEEALRTRRGHFFEYIKDIVKACPSVKLKAVVAAHREATEEIQQNLPILRVHRFSVWGHSNRSANPIVRLALIFIHNFRLARILKAVIREHGPFDIILAPTNLVDHVLGHYLVARWLKRQQLCTHYCLLLVDAVGTYDKNYRNLSFSRQTLLLRGFLRLFKPMMAQERVTLGVETEAMARHYHQFCGLNFSVFPHVVSFPVDRLDDFRTRLPTNRKPRFATYGFTRFDKGTDILQTAIHLVFRNQPEFCARFIIQWNKDFILDDGSTASIDTALQKHPQVTYLTELLDSEALLKNLAQTDLIILPYRKNFYYERLSRVAIDAAIAGIPFIAPRETWLESFQQKFGAGLSFQLEDPASLALALQEALPRLPELKRVAMERREIAAKAFGPHAFLHKLLECASLANPPKGISTS